MEKTKRGFKSDARLYIKLVFGVFVFGSIVPLLFVANKHFQEQAFTHPVSFEPVISPISLDLTCLQPLNKQNINQIRLLETYKQEMNWDGDRSIEFSPDGALLSFSNWYGVTVIDFQAKRRIYFRQLETGLNPI